MFRKFVYKETRSLNRHVRTLISYKRNSKYFSPNWKISTCVTYISPNEMKLVTKLPKGDVRNVWLTIQESSNPILIPSIGGNFMLPYE